MTTDTAILDRAVDDTSPVLRALIPTRDRSKLRPVTGTVRRHAAGFWAGVLLGAVLGLVAGSAAWTLIIAVASGTGAL